MFENSNFFNLIPDFPPVPGFDSGFISGEVQSQIQLALPVIPAFNMPAWSSFIPLPSNFTSDTPSTAYVVYPMPEPPADPSTGDMLFPMPNGGNATTQDNSPLQRFISEVKNRDFAFQSKYKVELPTAVGTGGAQTQLDSGSITADVISLYCEFSSFPSIDHETKPFHFYGPDFFRPSNVSYGGDNFSMSFLMDQDFGIKQYFDSWIRIINDPVSYIFNYPAKYMTSGIVITQLKHRGADLMDQDVGVYSVRLIDAFPKHVASLPLQGGSRDIHRLVVTFSYSRWIPAYGDKKPDFDFAGEIDVTGNSSNSSGQTNDDGYTP